MSQVISVTLLVSVTLIGLMACQGPSGPPGPQGLAGSQGPAGLQGKGGPTGSTGPPGPLLTEEQVMAVIRKVVEEQPEELRGPRGPTGDQGPAGTVGPRGESGPRGPKGERGPVTAPSAPTADQARLSALEDAFIEIVDTLDEILIKNRREPGQADYNKLNLWALKWCLTDLEAIVQGRRPARQPGFGLGVSCSGEVVGQ